MIPEREERLLVVVSAPSGAGKTSLCQKVAARLPNLIRSVSFTTRPPRPYEQDRVDYHFVDEGRFKRMIEGGELVEWALVHGHLYGTSRLLLEKHLDEGKDVILNLDTQGAARLRRLYPFDTAEDRPHGVFVFIVPPSFRMLEERLRLRGTDSGDEICRRLERAREEVKHYREYEYVIVNDVFERAFRELEAVIVAERCRSSRVDLTIVEEVEHGDPFHRRSDIPRG